MNLRTHRYLGEAVVVAGLVLLVHRLLSLGEGFLIGSFDDDGVYTVLAKAIAEGEGYRSLHLVGTPVQVKYPPGWPVVLAGLWRITGSAEGVLRAVQWLNPLAVATTAGLLWGLARGARQIAWGPGLLLLIVPLLLHPVIQYTAIPLVEPWFMLGWAGALVLWEWSARPGGRWRDLALPATGLVIAVTVLFRSQAIVLVPAFVLAVLLRRPGWRPGLIAISVMLFPLVLWWLYHQRLIAGGAVADLPDESTYASWFALGEPGAWGALVQSVAYNLRFYTMFTGGLLATPGGIPGYTTVAIALLGMALAAGWLLRREPFLALSLLGSLVLVMLWPWSQDRLLLSSLPFGGLLMLVAFAPHLARLSTRPTRWLNLAAVAGVALVASRQADIHQDVLTAAAEYRRPRMYTAGYQILENSRYIAQRSRWILTHGGRADRVMIDRQAAVYLYTGHQTVPPSPSESRLAPSVFQAPGRYLASRILSDSVSLVILALPKPGIQRDIVTILAYCPGVLSWAGVEPGDSPYMYRVRRDEACLSPIAAQPARPRGR
jgi:hypothetical protein